MPVGELLAGSVGAGGMAVQGIGDCVTKKIHLVYNF